MSIKIANNGDAEAKVTKRAKVISLLGGMILVAIGGDLLRIRRG